MHAGTAHFDILCRTARYKLFLTICIYFQFSLFLGIIIICEISVAIAGYAYRSKVSKFYICMRLTKSIESSGFYAMRTTFPKFRRFIRGLHPYQRKLVIYSILALRVKT